MAKYKYIEVTSPGYGGLNTYSPSTDLDNRESPDCQNVVFAEGEIQKRSGYGPPMPIKSVASTQGNTIPVEASSEVVHFDKISDPVLGRDVLFAWNMRDIMSLAQENPDYWKIRTKSPFRFTCDTTGNSDNPFGNAYSGHAGVTFVSVGGGNNDMVASFSNSNSAQAVYLVTISTKGTPDKYDWTVNGGGGATGVSITGSILSLDNGVKIRFDATTGHEVGDNWSFTYQRQDGTPTNTLEQDASDFQAGTASIKITVGVAHKTGLIAVASDASGVIAGDFRLDMNSSHDGDDLNTNPDNEYLLMNRVRFWFKCSVATISNTQISIEFADDSEADDGQGFTMDGGAGTGVQIPIVKANEWTYIDTQINFGTNMSPFTAVMIKVNSDLSTTGPVDLHFDQFEISEGMIRGIRGFDSRDRCWSSVVANVATKEEATARQMLFYVFGTGGSLQYDGNVRYLHGYSPSGSTNFRHATLLADGDDYNVGANRDEFHYAQIISGFKQHLHLLGIKELSSDTDFIYHSARDRWSDLLTAAVWDIGTSGFNVLADDEGGNIVAAKAILDDMHIFKNNSIIRATHIGGETGIFYWETISNNEGLTFPRMVIQENNELFWVSSESRIYRSSGGTQRTDISQKIINTIDEWVRYIPDGEVFEGYYKCRNHTSHISRLFQIAYFLVRDSEDNITDKTDAFPRSAIVHDYRQNLWTKYKYDNNRISALGSLANDTYYGDPFGNIYKADYKKFSDDTTAIDAYWQSKDFFISDENGRSEYGFWKGIFIEAIGDSLDVDYSVDNGENWITGKTITLDPNKYESKFVSVNTESNFFRVRFKNNKVDETFKIRYFSVQYKIGSAS